MHTLVAIAQKRRRPRQHECPPAVHAAAPTLRNHLRMGLSAWNTPLPAAFCNAAAVPVDTERERERLAFKQLGAVATHGSITGRTVLIC